jgi:hypothetical protein
MWILSGGIARLTGSDIILSRLLSVLGIGQLQAQAWMLPDLWGVVSSVLAAAVLASVTWFVVDRARGGHTAFLVIWAAAILASTVLGLGVDLTRAVGYLADFGPRGLTAVAIEAAPSAAFWGVMTGWIPALFLFRRLPVADRRASVLPPVLAVLVSVGLLVALGAVADDARQAAIVRENAEQQGLTEQDGAFADPNAAGDPVPEVAPGVAEPTLDADWCTPDRAMLLLGTADAATGHRAQVIHLMNFSEEPCIVEGYPDIAFADQNGHLLDVDVRPGSSFMAADPGSTRVTIPAQGQASTVIGWDANATDGALVARQLFAAPIAGLPRGPWPVELDVVEGSAVEITAWYLDATAGATP